MSWRRRCETVTVNMQLTIEGHPEEKPVGDVHHYGSQQIERVHVSGGVGHLLQAVQVFGCGAHADPHCPLEAGACQSCKTTMIVLTVMQCCCRSGWALLY